MSVPWLRQVEEIVPVGSLDPDFIHVPGVFVQRIYKATTMQKRIERLCVLTDDGVASSSKKKSSSDAAMRERIIRRAALEFEVCWLCWCVCFLVHVINRFQLDYR